MATLCSATRRRAPLDSVCRQRWPSTPTVEDEFLIAGGTRTTKRGAALLYGLTTMAPSTASRRGSPYLTCLTVSAIRPDGTYGRTDYLRPIHSANRNSRRTTQNRERLRLRKVKSCGCTIARFSIVGL